LKNRLNNSELKREIGLFSAAAIAFTNYFFRALSASFSPEFTVPFLGVNILTISPITILASSVIIIFSLIHYHSLWLGARVQNGLTIFKIGLIVVFDKLLIYRFHSCIVRHANRGGDDTTQDNTTCFEERL